VGGSWDLTSTAQLFEDGILLSSDQAEVSARLDSWGNNPWMLNDVDGC